VLAAPLGGWFVTPTPSLSLYATPELYWLMGAPLGGWLVVLPPLSAFAALHAHHLEFSAENSAPWPNPVLQGRFSIPPPPQLSVLDYISLFMFFSFAGRGFSLPRDWAGLFSCGEEVGRGIMRGAWCSPVPSAVSCRQLWSQLVERNGSAA
jgi:hypothetical protein